MSEITYRGIARDKLSALKERRTKHYAALYEAHEAAEKLARKHMGERGEVSVAICEEGKISREY